MWIRLPHAWPESSTLPTPPKQSALIACHPGSLNIVASQLAVPIPKATARQRHFEGINRVLLSKDLPLDSCFTREEMKWMAGSQSEEVCNINIVNAKSARRYPIASRTWQVSVDQGFARPDTAGNALKVTLPYEETTACWPVPFQNVEVKMMLRFCCHFQAHCQIVSNHEKLLEVQKPHCMSAFPASVVFNKFLNRYKPVPSSILQTLIVSSNHVEEFSKRWLIDFDGACCYK